MWVDELKPRKFENYYGNKSKMELLKRGLAKDTVPQILLWHGGNGSGKSSGASLLALALTCENRKFRSSVNPCGECAACRANFAALDKSTGLNTPYVKTFDCSHVDNQKFKNEEQINELIASIFKYAKQGEKAVFILEEFQALSMDDADKFLEPMTRMPKDVFIEICTDNLNKIPPAIVNRSVLLNLDKLGEVDAVDFCMDIVEEKGGQITKTLAKKIVRGCNCNQRAILNTLELLMSTDSLKDDIVSEYFKDNASLALDVLRNILDPSVSVSEFITKLNEDLSEVETISFWNDLRSVSNKVLAIAEADIDFDIMTSKDRDYFRELIFGRENFFFDMLKVLSEKPFDEQSLISLVLRCKLLSVTSSEKALLANQQMEVREARRKANLNKSGFGVDVDKVVEEATKKPKSDMGESAFFSSDTDLEDLVRKLKEE